MIEIKDIKPLLDIQDYSLFYLIAIILSSVIIVVVLLYKIYKYFKSKKANSKREKYLQILKNLNYNNPKDTAYDFTKYAKPLSTDEKSQELYDNIVQNLSNYKYKKDVANITDDIKQNINIFIDIVENIRK